MIALAEPVRAPLIVRGCRIELAPGSDGGAVQPYHKAQHMSLDDATKYLWSCSEASAEMGHQAVQNALAELSDFEVKDACILLASGRQLPELPAILASHALVHTAEGEFYRSALRRACESCGIAETGVPERDVAARVAEAIGCDAEELQATVSDFGKAMGPPWRKDEKLAALAAWLALARGLT